ncbi:hypothetical protein ABGF26_03950 [Helcococcus ovis]|uniref:hypothetical protein n=1 Tax=Helcococcus ovis TaxID=72026 RepID=UPI0038B9045D
MSNRQIYIEAYSKFIFYKYIYKIFLEQKYIEYFSKYDIEKMELIYQAMILDKELENKFIYGINSEFNHLKFMGFLAKNEYLNLENKILNMKNKSLNYKTNLRYVERILNDKFMENTKILIDKFDPFLNEGDNIEVVWNTILYSFDTGQIEVIFDSFLKFSEIENVKQKRITSEKLNEKLEEIDKKIEALNDMFPFNVENNILSKNEINKKIEEIKTEIKKSDKALKNITNMYLYVNEYNGLEN